MEAGGVVRHNVGLDRDVERGVVVAVSALMLARPVAEVGGRTVGSHRALADAGHSRGVVGAVDNGRVADVMGCGHEVDLTKEASVLKVVVGDGAGRVVD